MRRSVRVWAPAFVISAYYGGCIVVYQLVENTLRDGLLPYLPVGGIEDLLQGDPNQLELITSPTMTAAPSNVYPVQLAIACIVAVALMAPVSWMYFVTTPRRRVDQSFAHTMVVLPVIVAGIAMIVQNSIALAFSLAGIVAAVRFRFTLKEPAHTLYVFCAVAVGLGAGISSIGIATVISMAFVYGTMLLWALNYGANLNSPFFGFLASRDTEDDEI